METVPVTLGAVLPGTSGAPPLFGKAIGADETAGLASTFLQELKNAVTENYGGVRGLNKVEVATKQNVSTLDKEDEDKVPNPFGFAAIIPPPVPLFSPQFPGNGPGTDADVAQTELSIPTTTKAEIMNAANAVSSDVPVPWLPGLNTNEQAQGKEQAQEPNSSVAASPAIVSEKSTPPEFAHLRD